jgi:guanyl-specific ribonuclease Sa
MATQACLLPLNNFKDQLRSSDAFRQQQILTSNREALKSVSDKIHTAGTAPGEVLAGAGKSIANAGIDIHNTSAFYLGRPEDFIEHYLPSNGTQAAVMQTTDKLLILSSLLGGRAPVDVMMAEGKGAATTTSMVHGVKVVDKFVGTLEGTVNLKPTLDRIASGGKFPHVNDGGEFKNLEGRLPKQSAGYYTEYVVPTPGNKKAGVQRIVTGKNGEYYYTPDHYQTFIPLNK